MTILRLSNVVPTAIWLVANLAAQSVPGYFGPPPDEQHKAALANTTSVKLGLTLDRQEYLAGETIWVTTSASNTTAGAMEVFDPWQAASLDLHVWRDVVDDGQDHFRSYLSERNCCYTPNYMSPLTILPPGGVVQRRFIPHPESCAGCIDGSGVSSPGQPGRYRMAFCYIHSRNSCAYQEFTVVMPVVRGYASVQLSQPYRYKPEWPEKRNQEAYFFEHNGRRYVVVPRMQSGSPDPVVPPDRPLGGRARSLGPYDRIAETDLSATALQIQADREENLVVRWTENGQPRTFCISKDRETVAPCVPGPLTEYVTLPDIPDGPTEGIAGSQYKFSAQDSGSNVGHDIQYSFSWGDGSQSGWTPKSVTASYHVWAQPGVYKVTVQARCTAHPEIVSPVSAPWTIRIGGESVSAPSTPQGPDTGATNTTYEFTTGGGASSAGHALQYRLVWGDGSYSPWLAFNTRAASHYWAVPGTYTVTAQTRCLQDTAIVSPPSTGRTITITANEPITAPAIQASSPVAPGAPASFVLSGSTSSLGHNVQYFLEWGDGANSGWLPAGTTTATHVWSEPGTYLVTAYARCATHWAMISPPSASGVIKVAAPPTSTQPEPNR